MHKLLERLRVAAVFGALATAAVALFLIGAKPLTLPDIVELIDVRSQPFNLDRQNPERTDFGKLIWRGGLTLSSSNRHFGGFSGLAVAPGGDRLLAVSDAGVWMDAKIERDGRMFRGLTDARIGPLLALNGEKLSRVRDIDAEALTVSGKNAWIGYEQNHRIMRHDFAWGQEGPGPARQRIAPPPDFGRGGGNTGIEAVGVLQAGPMKGRLVVFAENRLDKNGGLKGWILGPGSPKRLSLKRLKGFDVTDLASLPDGGIVVLERRFRYSEGVQMRIRRIGQDELLAEKMIEGEVLLELDQRASIDNMEGIAAHRGKDGETILTLISDDNYNDFFQRTLLMQFAMKD